MGDKMDVSEFNQQALSRWENEGGAGLCGAKGSAGVGDWTSDVPAMTNAELATAKGLLAPEGGAALLSDPYDG
ncbi:MAG: hypothetical protein ABIP11_02400 [Luteimonas sp.]